MAQLPAGLNCSGITKTTVANCNGNMTCYSAPNSSPNSSINSSTFNLTGGASQVNNGSTMPNRALQSGPPQIPYSQTPSNNYPYQSMPSTTYPYSPYQQQQQQQQQPVILSQNAYTDSTGSTQEK